VISLVKSQRPEAAGNRHSWLISVTRCLILSNVFIGDLAMVDPILTEAAARRIVADVERIGAVRFGEDHEHWAPWWRGLAWNLEAVAEQAWLHCDHPSARDLVRNVAAAVAALEGALPQSPPELAGLTIQDLLVRQLPPDIDASTLIHAIAVSLRALKRASGDLRAEHERIDKLAERTGGAPSKNPEDMAIRALLEAFDGSFYVPAAGGERQPVRPSHTEGDKRGPFLRFCDAALSEFAAAWAVAHPGAPLAFGPDTVSAARVRRIVAASGSMAAGWTASP
jgi:hypothetical protein